MAPPASVVVVISDPSAAVRVVVAAAALALAFYVWSVVAQPAPDIARTATAVTERIFMLTFRLLLKISIAGNLT